MSLSNLLASFILVVLFVESPQAAYQGAIPAGIEVRSGLFIPVNNATSNNNSNNRNNGYNSYRTPATPHNYGNSNAYNGANRNNYPANVGSSYPYNVGSNYPNNVGNNNYNSGIVRSSNGAGANDIVMGNRENNDQLIFKTIVTKSAGWLRNVVSKDITYPDPNSKVRIERITSIVVTDNTKKGTGGHVQVTSGGVGKSFANFHFKSAYGKPIDLVLQIYGYER